MKGNQLRKGLRPSNAFIKGHSVWNKDLKGIHLSPGSEFKKGRESQFRVDVGTLSIRTHRGADRAWIKVAEPNIWGLRARLVWSEFNGEIPKGMVIHHIDRDTLNDDIDNLACLTKAQHMDEHRGEIRMGL